METESVACTQKWSEKSLTKHRWMASGCLRMHSLMTGLLYAFTDSVFIAQISEVEPWFPLLLLLVRDMPLLLPHWVDVFSQMNREMWDPYPHYLYP